MIFQGSLLVGFLLAAGKVIRATDSDLWIVPRGVDCLDFPSPLPDRFRDLAMGVPGIDHVTRVICGSVLWHTSSGKNQMVIVVGADRGVGAAFPLPFLEGSHTTLEPDGIAIDRSSAKLLEVHAAPLDVEINRSRARVTRIIDGFGSFLGSPYVFTGYEDAMRYLDVLPQRTMFLAASVQAGADVEAVRREIAAKLPETDVWTREEFARRSATYWMVQTGAGGAILTAALLGFVVGLVIVSQTIYATTMENIEEFATLKAIGAPKTYVRRVVVSQAVVSGLLGCVVGIAITAPVVSLVRSAISWVFTPVWLPLSMIVISAVMCTLASIISVRTAMTVEPGRVFRA
jgi:putative ABC transport system permease protein